MTITTKTFDQIVADIILKLQTDLAGVITDFNPGSVVRTIIEAFALQIGINSIVPTNIYQQLQNIYNGAFIDTATGDDLDNVVALVGVTRNAAVAATGVVRFYANPSPLADIIIPAGTQVSTQPNASGTQIVFKTDEQVILTIGGSYVDANVTAVVAGANGNVAANTVTYLATPIYGITSITNPSGMSGGVDEESDDDLRERAKHALEVAAKATVNALYYAVLGVDGVGSVTVNDLPVREITNEQHTYHTGTLRYTLYQADVINEATINVTGLVSGAPHTFVKATDYDIDTTVGFTNDLIWLAGGTKPDDGTVFEVDYRVNKIGEVDMIVAGTTIPMPAPVLAKVNATISDTKAAGIKVNVMEPTVIYQNIAVTITVLPGYDPIAVKAEVKNNLINYLNTLDVGYDVLLADIFQVCQDTVGVYNTTITTPTADVSIGDIEVARPGTITVS